MSEVELKLKRNSAEGVSPGRASPNSPSLKAVSPNTLTSLLLTVTCRKTSIAMFYDPAADPCLSEDLRAFMAAIQKGDVPKARSLLDKGVSPDGLMDDDAVNPIYMAVANQDVEMAELLVDRGARFRCDDFDHNELHIAARRGDIRILQFLIRIHEQKGLRIEGCYLGEETSLHVAAEVGFLDCAQLLVRHGANIHARQHWLWTPLFLAAANPNPKAIPVLEFLINSCYFRGY